MAPGSRLQELTAQYMQNPRRYFVPLANAYRQAGDLDRAIAICREHLPQQPGHMSGHIVLGRAYFGKGDLDAAREVFMTSIALDDENVIALRHLGDIARTRHATVEARQWFTRLQQSDPHDRDVAALVRELERDADTPEQASHGVEAGHGDVLPVRANAPRPVIEPQLSALADPTPPGLRAIVGERKTTPVVERDQAAMLAAEPAVAFRPLETFDLSTLDDVDGRTLAATTPDVDMDELAAASSHDVPPSNGEESGLIGFAADDLDSLVPTEASWPEPTPVSETSVAEAPPQAFVRPPVATPLDNAAIDGVVRDEQPDEVLARPGFGALASFASWRSQQERNTPLHAAPLVPEPVVLPAPVSNDELDADVEAFWSGSADATVTAPEFVTETMAALYAQQGFTQQALDVYRQLLVRAPGHTALRDRITALEEELAHAPARASLEDDADNALQFHDFDSHESSGFSPGLTIDGLFDDAPNGVDHAVLSADFDSGWADPPLGTSEPDDWFAGEELVDPIVADGGGAETGIFGIDVLGAAAVPSGNETGENVEVAAVGAGSAALDAVFGMPVIAAADAAAGDILARLAVQMVGRLPKEAPTLPTPQVLELPTPAPTAVEHSGSPAPLLSFDRFFSGSGSPPRARVDTPRAATGVVRPREPGASISAPSLSPTFGGVPVVPVTDPAPQSTWPGFDQFLPDRRRPAQSSPNPSGTPSSPVSPPSPLPGEAAAPETSRPAPSDFHRWLEGLS